jgi:hypothetical protein
MIKNIWKIGFYGLQPTWYIGMYYVKDLHGTSILYALLLVMAIKGILIGGNDG